MLCLEPCEGGHYAGFAVGRVSGDFVCGALCCVLCIVCDGADPLADGVSLMRR